MVPERAVARYRFDLDLTGVESLAVPATTAGVVVAAAGLGRGCARFRRGDVAPARCARLLTFPSR
ncbi:hypothetical protein [Dactylosporangium sp. CS-033363]|uniref:hypothetical protein n=1 Tax=Dactylosporangium sp. CS-033363 TaxID=3239935 RepID=UPI003D921359